MKEKEIKKYSFLAEIACDYYERGLSQNEIAEKICLSRTRVSRLLKEAEEAGIVQVTINYAFERHYELEERIKSRFPVKNVRILNNRIVPRDAIQAYVGQLASKYIMDSLRKDMVIGTSWGTTLADTVTFVQPAPFPIQVVQLMGAVPSRLSSHTPQGIVSNLASLFQCHGEFLNLPLLILDPYVRAAMCEDVNNKRVLNEGLFSDMALTSLSAIETIDKRELWLGYLTPELYRDACEKGAVGAIFARFFDRNGEEVDCEWNRSLVAISFEQFRQIPDSVIIASGREKALPLRYALKAGLADTLITDGTTASAVLHSEEGLHL